MLAGHTLACLPAWPQGAHSALRWLGHSQLAWQVRQWHTSTRCRLALGGLFAALMRPSMPRLALIGLRLALTPTPPPARPWWAQVRSSTVALVRLLLEESLGVGSALAAGV